MYKNYKFGSNRPHPWLRDSVFKIGRREVPSCISRRACRPGHSEFHLVFSETLVNDYLDSKKKSLAEGTAPFGLGPTCRQLALTIQHLKLHSTLIKIYIVYMTVNCIKHTKFELKRIHHSHGSILFNILVYRPALYIFLFCITVKRKRNLCPKHSEIQSDRAAVTEYAC